MRKPVFRVSDKVRHKASKRLEILDIDWTNAQAICIWYDCIWYVKIRLIHLRIESHFSAFH